MRGENAEEELSGKRNDGLRGIFSGIVEKFLPHVVGTLFVSVEISFENIREEEKFDYHKE